MKRLRNGTVEELDWCSIFFSIPTDGTLWLFALERVYYFWNEETREWDVDWAEVVFKIDSPRWLKKWMLKLQEAK